MSRRRWREMATKSFLKDVTMKNKKQSLRLIQALEQAHNKKCQDVEFTRSCMTATKDDIRKMFLK